jgi:hypothetical protein
MKKILLSMLICGSLLSASAQVTDTTTNTTVTTTHKYYYYPSSNIYYDNASGNYWYWDKSTSQWMMTQTLPSTITLEKTPQYPITYNGNDPWKNNMADMKKYKVRKNGTIKIKPKDKD